MRPLFSYYGGKYRAAPRYPAPEHDTIVEPFAGSAGYACRYPDRKVILVEKDPIVSAVWRYLINVSASEIRALRDVPFTGTVDDAGAVCQEAKWLVGFWLNKASTQPKRRPSSFMRSGLRPNCVWGEAVRERIASSLESIRHWKIIEGDYLDSPNIEATWFIDPPYQKAGKYYRESEVSYNMLALWVVSRRGLTIACEQDGATWLPFAPLASIKATSGHSKEVVYVRRNITDRAFRLERALRNLIGGRELADQQFYRCTGKPPHREAGEPMRPYTLCAGCVAEMAREAISVKAPSEEETRALSVLRQLNTSPQTRPGGSASDE